jgi:hypothetical protein
MAKIPKKPEEIFQVYGSGARGEYIPKKSDLNFLIVLTEGVMDRLREAFPLMRKWRKRRVNIPLFLTEEYITSSLDSFPVEFLNLRDSHVLVFGKDVLKELSFDKKSIRLQCERELKGKLLLLREAYLDSEGKTRNLGQVSSASLTAFLSLFRALLFLRDREIPRHNDELIRTTAKEIGFNEKPFMEVLSVRAGKAKPRHDEMEGILEKYLEAIRELWKTVDQLEVKEG